MRNVYYNLFIQWHQVSSLKSAMVGIVTPWIFENAANKGLIFFVVVDFLYLSMWYRKCYQWTLQLNGCCNCRHYIVNSTKYWGNILVVSILENYNLIPWGYHSCHWWTSDVPTYICVISLECYSLMQMKITNLHVGN